MVYLEITFKVNGIEGAPSIEFEEDLL